MSGSGSCRRYHGGTRLDGRRVENSSPARGGVGDVSTRDARRTVQKARCRGTTSVPPDVGSGAALAGRTVVSATCFLRSQRCPRTFRPLRRKSLELDRLALFDDVPATGESERVAQHARELQGGRPSTQDAQRPPSSASGSRQGKRWCRHSRHRGGPRPYAKVDERSPPRRDPRGIEHRAARRGVPRRSPRRRVDGSRPPRR